MTKIRPFKPYKINTTAEFYLFLPTLHADQQSRSRSVPVDDVIHPRGRKRMPCREKLSKACPEKSFSYYLPFSSSLLFTPSCLAESMEIYRGQALQMQKMPFQKNPRFFLPGCINLSVLALLHVSINAIVVMREVSCYPFLSGPLPFVRRFSFEDIKRATGGFRRIIAKHPHGAVYKAQFRDGLVAVVKEVTTFHQGKDAFYEEMQLLRRFHHRHLVPLRGFATGHERFLVFEYTENGTLKEHLNDPLKTPLNWRTRLQIAIGVTAALEYLHFFCEPPIYHVSINSSNVLLDENFVAKLSGVAFLGSTGSHVGTSHASCSKGRMDPDCRNMIFQLGVLILELITGQSSEEEGTDLVQWVQESSFTRTSSIHKMIDPDLGNSYDSRELKSLLAVARFCTKTGEKPTFSIQQILRYLQGK
ncbi:Protein kinase domain [Macleaya cordata]|uniref:Protein kinase domain n=1 Tax=Macleaya cordata TaxID=56857 RepID=A0A200Q9J9_MACCD|nr:Protein kinase domain [Macleaya cordata]